MDESSYPVIKVLETTELFNRNSDLLMMHKSSIYYKTKKNKELLEVIKHSVGNFENKMLYSNLTENSAYVFKILDNFLFQLINYEILYLEKGSIRFEKSNDNLLVGHTTSTTDQGKKIEKYHARFFSMVKK